MNYRYKTMLRIFLSGALFAALHLLDTPIPESLFHNCRFWGIIYETKDQPVLNVIYNHLDSLRSLGVFHSDGWGIAYYVTLNNGNRLPVVERGEPEAPLDPRYDIAVDHIATCSRNSAIAHVRHGSSGPSTGIPDPHPFSRYSVFSTYHMFFAHNGTINTDILLDLVTTINPNYIIMNPPDYIPYLDSDLYGLLLIEIIDMNPGIPIEECIRIAVTKIDSAIAPGSVQCNFVMSDSTTMYAVNYSRTPIEALTLYLYAPGGQMDFWAIASEPLDDQHCWFAIPNSTLVVLRPNMPPRFVPVLIERNRTAKSTGLNIIGSNPTMAPVSISFTLPEQFNANQIYQIRIFNCTGQLVRTLSPHSTGYDNGQIAVWNGCDERNKTLPSGLYYCHLFCDNISYTKKIVYLR